MKKYALLLLFINLVVGVSVLSAQTRLISGTVTDKNDGSTLPGVSVVVKGTTIGATTDIDGTYSFNIPTGSEVLVFSYVGMLTQDVAINGRSVINVKMSPDVVGVDEVIVVAYGTSTREAFTGSAEVVGADQLETRTVTSPVAAIEGAITGIQVLSASGQPGSSPSIVIRGVGTLNGSVSPLYIVDGIQFDGALTSLNPEDIKSMTVLKDASSTALYGSRAANGVVMITTKSGRKSSDMKVSFSAQYGVITKAIPEYDAAGPGLYYELMWEGYKNSLTGGDAASVASSSIYNRLGYNPFDVENDQIVGADGRLNPNANIIAAGLNWYDALEQTGERQNYSVNISGGGKNHDLYFSTSYLDEKGYVVTSSYNRLTSRLNGNFTANDWLDLGGNLNIALTNTAGPFSRGTSIANPFGFVKGMGSIYPVHLVDPVTGDYILDEKGDLQWDLGEGYSEHGIQPRPVHVGRHAVAEAELNSEERRVNNLSMRYYAQLNLFEGLTARVSFGRDIQDYIGKKYENHIVGDGAPSGRYSEDRYRRTIDNFNQVVSYANEFNLHNIEITAGHESFQREYTENSGIKNTQTVVGIYEYDNFSVTSGLSGYSSEKTTEGYFARINYNYKDKYYLSGSLRRDGTSVFNQDVRWGNFYSVGASWRMDQEDFLKNNNAISKLKLRASFGQVGNDNLGDFYISQARYSLLPNAGEPGIWWSDLGNNSLTWETVESWDVALDFGFLDNRIEGSLEFYKKTSSDLLYNVPIPLSNGHSEGPANIGDLFNEGFEIGITGKIVKSHAFNWDMHLQASTLKNEITYLPSAFVDGSKRWDVGYSRYDFYIYHYAGVDPENGDALYYMFEDEVDSEGVSTGNRVPVVDADGVQETTNDYQVAGKAYAGVSSIPDVIGSLQNTFSYKGFSLDLLFTFSIGGEILDYGYAAMMHEGEYGESLHPDMAAAWRSPGDITNVPRLENGAAGLLVSQSTRFLTDASYFSFKSFNLSYTFSKEMIKGLGFSNLKLFVAGENLFISTKRTGLNPQYNLAGTPEGNDYNPARVISMGVNVSF